MEKLSKHYNELSGKDKRALNILTAVMLPLFIYFALIQPSREFYSSNKSLYQENKELIAWINLNKGNVASAKTGAQARTQDEAIIQTVSKSAEENNIKLSRLQPEGKTKVRIWINDGDFSDLIKWLSDLSQNTGVNISSISIDDTGNPGKVDIQSLLYQE
ncbi:MAG: type II secretion system protein M [Porticoccaceae bacterium]|nr:type II secretion system protein M [Porticoccaceae bacterium]